MDKVRCNICGEEVDTDSIYVWKYKGKFYCELCQEELIEEMEKEGELDCVKCSYNQYYDSSGEYICDDYDANPNDVIEELNKRGFFNQFQ